MLPVAWLMAAVSSPDLTSLTISGANKGVRSIGRLGFTGRGEGIAAEAVAAVIDQIFAEGQRRVFADTDPENVQSRGLLERLGFKLEGHLRAEWETHIGVRDSLIWGLLEDEWKAARPRT